MQALTTQRSQTLFFIAFTLCPYFIFRLRR